MPVPVVEFSDERLANGLRLIVAEDHLAPVVAVNLWYNVGSKHEVTGKTGFAHLFEHVMFQGSANVGKAEHMALVQAAGGTLNGTTWVDRTNYYETLPSHELELALWLEADRMGTLLGALSQENLDNQRDVVKNEKRWSYDNRPYGSWMEKMLAHLYPEDHPYHHSTIGSMADLDAASLDDVKAFFATYYVPNNAVLSVAGDCERAQVRAWAEKYFGPIAPNPAIPPLPDMSLPELLGEERRETVEDQVPLARVYVAFRAPAFGDTRLDAIDLAGQILTGGKGSRLHKRLVREERIAQDVSVFTLPFVGGAAACIGWATVRPGVEIAKVEAAYLEELEKLATEAPSDDELARAKALTEADELGSLARVEERADRLSMYATLFDDPALINTMLPRYLSVTGEQIRDAARAIFRADNRVILTYVPRTSEFSRRRCRRRDERGGGGVSGREMVVQRPVPGEPRPYEFPTTFRTMLGNGLRVIVTPMPGRELIAASLALRAGAVDEPRRCRRGDGPRGTRPDRGHRGARRHRPRRGGGAPRGLAPCRVGLGRDLGRTRRSGQPPGTRPRAARRGRAPAQLPRGRDRAPARRAAHRPAPGQGGPEATSRRGLRLLGLCLVQPIPPARRRVGGDGGGPDVR